MLCQLIAFRCGEIFLRLKAALKFMDLGLGEEDARLATLTLLEQTGLVAVMAATARLQVSVAGGTVQGLVAVV